ncbi:ECF transporter substrate-specific protein PdxU2 [Streptococcus varani]|uniref:ECF transporter substrate-specific protein PdxU2 n=1 Tax=Streptococcus varani TaxID=1608583 RepID=A0A0E4H3N0_9STRE|nr:ECF transporter S component [Streptococcus varani]CQR24204.1 ECF transporter substrate-specific protein PdxU2 [Streptococcus varani]
MTNKKTKELTLLAVLTALSVALAYVHIPSPTGFLTLLDIGVYFTAFYLGSKSGAIVGGLSGFLIDLLLGYPQYMIHSLIAHGAQGFFAGWTGKKRILGIVLASLAMVGWYVVAALVLGYGLGGAIGGILGNVLQNAVGIIGGYSLCLAIQKVPQRGAA